MKAGDQVFVMSGAQADMTGTVSKPNGQSVLVRFDRAVQRRNGMWSEECWVHRRQLRAVEAPETGLQSISEAPQA